jgi:hypothetical protein
LGDNIDSVAVLLLPVTFRWLDFVLPMYCPVYTRAVDHVYTQFRLATELRNVSDSVTSAAVCTVTVTGGETSDEGQTVERTVIEFIIITDCLYNMGLVRECYLESTATRLVKKTRYKGSIETCLLQECQHCYY